MRRRPVLVQLAGLFLALTGLTACTGDDASRPPESGDISSPDGAARTLADALASGDFADVGFGSADPAAVTEEYAAVVEGLEDLTPTVTLADVSEPSGEPATATATYDWTWPLGPDGWQYSSQATLTQTDDAWLADWDPATIEPTLGPKVTMDLVGLGAKRGDILGAGGLALVTNRPVVRIGIDRSQVGAAKAGASAREVGAARRHRPGGVREAGDRRRTAGLRRGDRLPPGRGAPRCAVWSPTRQGRSRHRRRAAAGADQGLRRADPRLGRRGDRRDDRGEPRRLLARRHRGPVGAPGQVRRAAARHARAGGQRRRLGREDP